MNKLSLSSNLTTITTEIKSYQTIGGQAIFEIGRRLKWVKKHDLAHGEFGKWLESISMNRHVASKFMKITEELPNGWTSNHLGIDALYLIATMPEEERDKPQQLPDGQVKTPDAMTVRELREVKKQLKQRDELLANKEQQIQQQTAMIDRLHQQEPKTVTIEKIPDDYEQLKQQVKDAAYYKRQQNPDKQRERELAAMKLDAEFNIYTFIRDTQNYLSKDNHLAINHDQFELLDSNAKEELLKCADQLFDLGDEIKSTLNGRHIIQAKENSL